MMKSSPRLKDSMLIKNQYKQKKDSFTAQGMYNMDTRTNWNSKEISPKIKDIIERSFSPEINKFKFQLRNTQKLNLDPINQDILESSESEDDYQIKSYGNYDYSPMKSANMVFSSMRPETPVSFIKKLTIIQIKGPEKIFPNPTARSLMMKKEIFEKI